MLHKTKTEKALKSFNNKKDVRQKETNHKLISSITHWQKTIKEKCSNLIKALEIREEVSAK